MLDAPQLGMREIERYGDVCCARGKRDGLRRARLRAAVRAKGADAYRNRRAARERTFEKDAVVDHRTLGALLGADGLAPHPYRSIRGQPHVPHQAAVCPPVIARLRSAALRKPGYGRDARPIVDPHGEHVRPAQVRRNVEGIFGEAALMTAELHAIQPHPGAVEGRAKMQFDVATF